MSRNNSAFGDFEDSLLDTITADLPPRTVVLASVHRPSFTQQLTFLHDHRPALTEPLPPAGGVLARGRRISVREINPH
ncbi:hypothetical protein [Ramlibacter albus]|uniref:Uncharacterized protein n=1 Tax=Ramlibacter albus TaxID=2079448 RepID=A0A923M9R0_9BURK|nr:hypothetical protein [Ramlibacter albus]MBC5765092.1 hypothetical protein [Ramlibacter albus]